jgi:hypothetical protein
MARKSIGWIILSGCMIAVATAVFCGRESVPQTAQAATPPPQANVVSAETTQVCQAVVDQLATIQRIVLEEKRSRTIKPQAANDELVAQEYRIDTSKCPTDFRMAELRFVTAEDSARIHAHMDRTGKAEEILGAAVSLYATGGLSAPKSIRSWNDYNEKIADEQKQDLANMQSAFLDFAQVAMSYGVK